MVRVGCEDRSRVPALTFSGETLAALDDEHVDPGCGERPPSGPAATRARADHDDIGPQRRGR